MYDPKEDLSAVLLSLRKNYNQLLLRCGAAYFRLGERRLAYPTRPASQLCPLWRAQGPGSLYCYGDGCLPVALLIARKGRAGGETSVAGPEAVTRR